MNITIFTICTGKYNIFFESFYNSCEKNFLTSYNKKYFVFTDSEIISRENIVKVNQNKLGWPFDTMMRFHMFNRIEDEIKNSDFTFFFNVNLNFLEEIGNEVLPSIENNYLVGVNHPGYFNTDINFVPFERNKNSQFYIPLGQGSFYFQGCFIGGRTREFMEMSNDLERLINVDLSNNIIPIWHDESAMNWYYSKKSPLAIDPNYAWPEVTHYDGVIKGLQVDKNKFGGHNFLRN
jgi:hypothetical protein